MSETTAIIIAPPLPQMQTPLPPLDPEQQLVRLWLQGLSRHTRRAYLSDLRTFRLIVPKPLQNVTLVDLNNFVDYLDKLPLVPGSRHRIISGVKSLFFYATKIGFLPLNTAMPLRMPACKDTLNERILEADEVWALIDAARSDRNKVMLELLYVTGLRVSELVTLTWSDTRRRVTGGQITVLGKGNKTRTVLVPEPTWGKIDALRPTSPDATMPADSRVFPLSPSQVGKIVRAAAVAAGINKPVSPHWLRHCHCSHALEAGSDLALIQATAGHSSVATTSRYLHARPQASSSGFIKRKPT